MCQDTKWVNTDGKMVTVDLLKECCHNHQFVKNTVYVKCKKAKPNKRRYTCNNVTNKIESIKSQLDGVFVWVNSRSWWWTGRPGMLRFMGSQRVGHDWVTELNWGSLLVVTPVTINIKTFLKKISWLIKHNFDSPTND